MLAVTAVHHSRRWGLSRAKGRRHTSKHHHDAKPPTDNSQTPMPGNHKARETVRLWAGLVLGLPCVCGGWSGWSWQGPEKTVKTVRTAILRNCRPKNNQKSNPGSQKALNTVIGTWVWAHRSASQAHFTRIHTMSTEPGPLPAPLGGANWANDCFLGL